MKSPLSHYFARCVLLWLLSSAVQFLPVDVKKRSCYSHSVIELFSLLSPVSEAFKKLPVSPAQVQKFSTVCAPPPLPLSRRCLASLARSDQWPSSHPAFRRAVYRGGGAAVCRAPAATSVPGNRGAVLKPDAYSRPHPHPHSHSHPHSHPHLTLTLRGLSVADSPPLP